MRDLTTISAGPKRLTYTGRFDVPGHFLVSDATMIVEKLRELGEARFQRGDLDLVEFRVTTEGDLWDLRGQVSEIERYLAAVEINFSADRDGIQGEGG